MPNERRVPSPLPRPGRGRRRPEPDRYGFRLLALGGDLGRVVRAARPTGDLGPEPDQPVVLAAHHALLHRDQRVVGDLDVLWADFSAALGDVAVAQAEVV